jgi:hypothetical protein
MLRGLLRQGLRPRVSLNEQLLLVRDERGEPRGSRSRKADPAKLDAIVVINLCVPTASGVMAFPWRVRFAHIQAKCVL